MAFLKTVAIVLAACAAGRPALAFMDQLPLEVLSITPVPSDGGSAAMQVSGKDALTVTFSRAVIALGSDFGPEGQAQPADKVPFTITGANVPGRLRWVTTFTARFDPTDDWPTDLSFDLEVNEGLVAFDGTALTSAPAARHFTTPAVTAWLNSVRSAAAAAATDNTCALPMGAPSCQAAASLTLTVGSTGTYEERATFSQHRIWLAGSRTSPMAR